MFLVLKRFPYDDVPIRLTKTKAEAMVYVGADWIQDGYKHATTEQQDWMYCDIGSEFCDAYLIVEFDSSGKPVNSQIINTGD